MDKDIIILKTEVIKEGEAKGAIWERRKDGLFRSSRFPNLLLEEWQVKHDLYYGHIKMLEYETNSSKEAKEDDA